MAIALVVRSRRPERPDEVMVTPPPVAQWPPAPLLGTPTAEDLRRYAPRPSVMDRPGVAAFLKPGKPGKPLEPAARRRLTRWGVAALVLLALAGGTRLMESAVFSKPPALTPQPDQEILGTYPGEYRPGSP